VPASRTAISYNVAPNVALTFDWSGVSEDFLGGRLDPKTDIGYVEISMVTYGGTAPQLAEDFMTLRSPASTPRATPGSSPSTPTT